jgi:hypothetical protein
MLPRRVAMIALASLGAVLVVLVGLSLGLAILVLQAL